jgi:hypothetical protein
MLRRSDSSAIPRFPLDGSRELLLPLPAVGLYKPMRYLGPARLK